MKSKLFVCFRPVVIESDDGNSKDSVGRPDNRVSTYIAVAQEQSRNISAIKSPVPEKRESRRSFSRALKAILIEVSLRRSVRDRNVRQLTFRMKKNGSCKSEMFADKPEGIPASPKSVDTDISETRNDPPSSDSESKNYRSSPDKHSFSRCGSLSNSPNRMTDSIRNGTDTGLSSINSGIFVILMTLCATILWGKVCAILFTSIWLYFLRRLSQTDLIPETTVQAPATESLREYKKRVIMEGLLERKRSLNF